MRIRLYSVPVFGGQQNVGVSMWVSYVRAENGGGGDVTAMSSEIDAPANEQIPANSIRGPLPEEIFSVEGVTRSQLQSGDRIQLRTSDSHYVGIFHDEEAREDSVVATATSPGIGETWIINFLETLDMRPTDPYGPSYTISLMGHNANYLSFPPSGDGPLCISSSVVGSYEKFMLDYLPDSRPGCLPGLLLIVKRRWSINKRTP